MPAGRSRRSLPERHCAGRFASPSSGWRKAHGWLSRPHHGCTPAGKRQWGASTDQDVLIERGGFPPCVNPRDPGKGKGSRGGGLSPGAWGQG